LRNFARMNLCQQAGWRLLMLQARVHAYTHMCTHTHICVRIHTYVYAYTHVCTHTHICVRIHTYVYAYTHIRIHTYVPLLYTLDTYIAVCRTHTQTHIHTQVCVSQEGRRVIFCQKKMTLLPSCDTHFQNDIRLMYVYTNFTHTHTYIRLYVCISVH